MSHLFGRSPNGYHKARRSPHPFSASSSSGSSSALKEKLDLDAGSSPTSSSTTFFLPLPFSSNPHRRFKLVLPIPHRIYRRLPTVRVQSRKFLAVVLGLVLLLVWLLGKRKKGDDNGGWQPPWKDPDTLVFSKEELKSVWEWEIMSGHWPSARKAPRTNLPSGYVNPAVPKSMLPRPPLSAGLPPTPYLTGSGPERTYKNLTEALGDRSYAGWPKRPEVGSAADLDVLLDHCDFSKGLFVRDCLEVLRVGGGLDNSRRIRRGDLSSWSYVFNESPTPPNFEVSEAEADQRAHLVLGIPHSADGEKVDFKRVKAIAGSPGPKLSLPPPFPPRPVSPTPNQPCDPNRPRLFHIFWAGPFTDKPYMAIMSFLYTQNLGLDLPHSQWSKPQSSSSPPVCRPQFLVWINPGHAASVPNPGAKREMFNALATNPWSAPFLDARFKDVVKFKMWNTTEQLDGVPELKDHWRKLPILNSGGHQYVPPASKDDDGDKGPGGGKRALTDEEVLAGVATGTSEKDYDKLSTVLSDMVRFVLLHRFGGIYLDADTLFLRDWEELWNYRGAFAYRWSWHEKYNTAIIKMHKGSALTSFLFKTALENKMDFHPMTISRYLNDAGLEPLLFRLPDALFDSAWLNMEGYQRDRPPFPYFYEFKKFFVGDKQATGEPQAAGFHSFFRGAFCYHYHNNWWLPFDPSRNFPDLGRRFLRGERLLREALLATRSLPPVDSDGVPTPEGPVETAEDDRDISWSAVLKRTFEAYVRGEAPNAYGEWIGEA
ncbi:hypothetical protein BDY24DRAFT_345808 [Mrakia frigida]|uniref:uncharacterized protein n=1 Tax=Mrakia frigida TaxID=29902 RepID=UPI003FCC13F8